MLYELEPPRLDVGAGDGGAGDGRPHFARIVLAPGAAAVATIAINPAVVRTMGRGTGSDGGGGAPAKLTKGRYVLHVGELLADVDAGAPARVTWDLP
jgi:hypothetical protein